MDPRATDRRDGPKGRLTMNARLLITAALLAGGVLAGTNVARAATVDFTGYDLTTPTQVDVSGSFSYDPSALGGGTTIGFADLTGFSITLTNFGPTSGVTFTFGLPWVQAPQASTRFQFDTSTGAPAYSSGDILTKMASGDADGFEIYESSPTFYIVEVNNGSYVD
ncbi:MAG: hypothetical protein ACRDNS_25280, partial [Trebonia sp.]